MSQSQSMSQSTSHVQWGHNTRISATGHQPHLDDGSVEKCKLVLAES